LIADGAGGAIAVWTNKPDLVEADVFAQHVLASGVVDPRWPTSGVPVGTAPRQQDFAAIASDGAGGAIICWDDSRSAATTGIDFYAQHVLSSGVVDPGWPANGRAVCALTGNQGRGTITTDGAGGAILTWSDGRLINTFHIFA